MSESTREIKNYRGLKCLNCNHPLDISDKFCPNCGQKNTTKRLSLKDFVDEFLANFYAYDSKVRNTIIKLFTKPGKAAKEFIDGKRQTYANPFRFYLSVSLIYFIFSGLVTKFSEESISDNSMLIDDFKKTEIKEINTTELDTTKLSHSKDTIDNKNKEKAFEEKSLFGGRIEEANDYLEFYEKNKNISIDSSLTMMGKEKTNWNRYKFKKTIQLDYIFNESNESYTKAFENFILDKLPFILFVSLPFLAICFSFVYLRSHLNYAEHLVLVFNLMTFFFLLLLIDEILNLFINFNLSFLISIGFPLYFYRALRNFYQQRRWKTILKFVILTSMLFFTAIVITLLVVLIMFLLY